MLKIASIANIIKCKSHRSKFNNIYLKIVITPDTNGILSLIAILPDEYDDYVDEHAKEGHSAVIFLPLVLIYDLMSDMSKVERLNEVSKEKQ